MSATSTVLKGLALATGIASDASDASDGVPVVQQILSVVSRVLSLGEQIDKNREDLRALADRARSMDATIRAIVADRELNDDLLRRLEGLRGVLCAIEKLFTKYMERGSLRNFVGYIFRFNQEVTRVRGDFEDRLRELELSSSLDVNIIARGCSRFIGELRNVRHSEIHLLRRLAPLQLNNGKYSVDCHLATCEGSNHVFVVRDIVPSWRDEGSCQHVHTHERILEHMSLIQNRHPAIAYLYGRNSGPKHNRFIVLNTGTVQLFGDLLRNGLPEISVVGRMVAKLIVGKLKIPQATATCLIRIKDALCHLQKHGVAWNCYSTETLCLDQNLEPKIGVIDELYTLSNAGSQAVQDTIRCSDILNECHASSSTKEYEVFRRAVQLFAKAMVVGHLATWRVNSVERADIPTLIPLSRDGRARMQLKDNDFETGGLLWGDVLLSIASGLSIGEGTMLRAEYICWDTDFLEAFYLETCGETIYHVNIKFEIPGSAAEGVRRRLGIPEAVIGQDGECPTFIMKTVIPPGESFVEFTGWERNPVPYVIECA